MKEEHMPSVKSGFDSKAMGKKTGAEKMSKRMGGGVKSTKQAHEVFGPYSSGHSVHHHTHHHYHTGGKK